MKQLLANWTIAHKLRALALVMTVGLVGMVALQLWQAYHTAYQDRQQLVRSAVEAAAGTVAWFQQREARGELTREEAQGAAASALKSLRYRGSEYFWVNDLDGRMVMHATKPALDGTNVLGMKDPNGKALFAEFIETVKRQDAGFVDYLWPKPGSDAPVPKVSYVVGFKPWGWVIGSGLYLDDLLTDLRERALLPMVLLVLGMALTWTLERLINRSISAGIHKAVRVATAVASGDLTQHIEPRGRDEIGQLLRAMRQMNDRLREMVGTVRDAARDMEVAAEQIAAGNTDLSVRTEQTAANLERTASSMRDIAETVGENVSAAQQVTELARSASGVAGRTGEIVAEVVTTMGNINDSSRRIHDIIGVIDSIAFQTNILALNAAVEAARAGEQGRGFAVVASEVRALAQRSSQAAKEIRELIARSTEKVDSGAALVTNAGDTMRELVQAVERVTSLTVSVRDRADGQSREIRQVTQEINQLDGMTSQNAALVEQSAAAAASLRDQAGRLLGSVSSFRLTAA